uniref:Uncharacterized protein n=1 Tax=Cyclopterus lumpus TaxID=8103 RepID=A0A8C2WAG4_CYCLU
MSHNSISITVTRIPCLKRGSKFSHQKILVIGIGKTLECIELGSGAFCAYESHF